MYFRKAFWLSGIFTVFALIIVACGGADPTFTPSQTPTAAISPTPTAAVIPTSPPTPDALIADEEKYFASVREAQALQDGILAAFGQLFRQSYPVREVLLGALLKAGVGTAFTGKLEALEALDPPERFQEDHRNWVATTRELVRLDAEAAQAVRDDDVVNFVVLNGELGEIFTRGTLALSAVYCENSSTGPQMALACSSAEPIRGTEYDAQLNKLLPDILPSFASTTGTIAFPLSLKPEEFGQLIKTYAPRAEEKFQEFRKATSALAPPAVLLADHERLQMFFDDVLSTFEKASTLTEAGESMDAKLELARIQLVYCDARQSFQEAEFKAAVAVIFQGPPTTCDGAPY